MIGELIEELSIHDAEVLAHLHEHGGVITRAEARGLGVGVEGMRSLVTRRVLRRICRGAYVGQAGWERADDRERRRLEAAAVVAIWPQNVILSHTTAAQLHGLPLSLTSSRRVHGARTSQGQHRRTERYTIHTGYALARHDQVQGLPVIEPAFAILGVCELHSVTSAVMAGDKALRDGLTSMARLVEIAETCQHHPTHRRFRRALELMDPQCESPGETRTRMQLSALGYQVQSQVVIRDDHGAFIARVDFMIVGTPVVIEFDGLGKYATAEALRAEKVRETRLVRQGYVVVRLLWEDLKHPDRVRALIERAIARAA